MYTVLAVDDEIENLEMVEYALQEEFQVVPVKSGNVALTYLQKNRPDLILLDIRMPELDGIEVYRRIKEQKDWEDIPVIFLTAANDVETENNCFAMGAVDFVTKPFDPRIIRKRVKVTLDLLSRGNMHKAISLTHEEKSPEKGSTLDIMTNGMQISLLQKEIYYIEVFNNTCIIRTANKEIPIRETLDHMNEKLGKSFLRVGRSYIINVDYVAELQDEIIVMQSGKRIKIPRRQKKDIMQRIMTIHHMI